MAPIVKENWEAIKQLSKVCNVRHVPLQYWRTTIIDGKYLLQSKTPSSSREKLGLTDFDNAFYSDDPEWVKTMRTALLDIWKSAQPPSTETLASIIGPYGSPLFPMPNDDLRSKFIYKVIDFKPPGTITQEDVLNKIMRGKRFIVKDPYKDIQRSYGSYAFALIHPPDQINLPDMLIQVQKHHKKSSYGEGDDLTVYLWLDTPTGHAYVPVAAINDNPNVPSTTGWDSSDTLIAKNYHLVKKEELQVLVHGNTIFAGWTVPIQLYPPNFGLPPACLLIEGYGDLITSKFTMASPSGFRTTFEDNTFNAFVTFIHKELKYSGPGTDGVFIRDSVSTTIPP